jgi:RimJ/RimL family protein N-acetyltransferase/adenylate kinase family enzyme
MASWRRVAVISSASGNGKTTMGRELAGRLGVPFIEVDALVHGPNWTETPNEVLAQRLAPVLASDGWVIDNVYRHKLGDLVLDAADLVVWLDLPMRVWLPRLVRRTHRRLTGPEELWNGNRESLRGAVWGRDSLFGHALRTHFARRREWPVQLSAYPVIRLRTGAGVRAFLAGASSARQRPGMGPPVSERRTARLRLRRVTEADIPAVVAISTDPRTNRHRPDGTPTPDQAAAIARSFIRGWEVNGIGYWLVEYEARNVGVAGITPITLGDVDCWNLYYRFSPEVQGRGLAAEATGEAIAVARGLTPEWPVVARTRPDNEPAIRLALAIGLVRRPDLDGDGYVAFAG